MDELELTTLQRLTGIYILHGFFPLAFTRQLVVLDSVLVFNHYSVCIFED